MPDQNADLESSVETTDVRPHGVKNIHAPDFKTIYTNNAAFGTTVFDLSITFGEISDVDQSGPEPVAVVTQYARVVMSPIHAKILAYVFQKQVEAYEKRFGSINIPGSPLMASEVAKRAEPSGQPAPIARPND